MTAHSPRDYDRQTHRLDRWVGVAQGFVSLLIVLAMAAIPAIIPVLFKAWQAHH